MLIRRPPDIPGSEITPEALGRGGALTRRRLLGGGLALVGTATTGALFHTLLFRKRAARLPGGALPARRTMAVPDALTPYEHVVGYNNFYEFGTDKQSPAYQARHLRTRPWTVRVEGEVARPRVFDIDHFLRADRLEERVYRLRCVEAWSMVIPWIGLPLRALLEEVRPTSAARFVEFTTLLDKQQMPEQRTSTLPWPYIEGLRMDEAMHPLTLLAVGLYGQVLPNQNGAPLRLVVPWKYGFKSIKSIVRIRLLRERPDTTWPLLSPDEYGFYANVNPAVSHPRWTQMRERRLGELGRRPTLPFNGYAEQVASMYAGMDLRKDY